MDMIERIPSLDDRELSTLLLNAEKRAATGTNVQQQAATRLLAVIQAEMAARVAKLPPPKPKATRAKKAVAKVAVLNEA